MKKIIQLLLLFSITFNCFSQSSFDKSLSLFSNDLATKLIQKNKKKIVVLFIKENNRAEINKTDNNKSNTVAGKYIADIISINLINDLGDFEVFDRDNLSGIVEAKKMIDEGYIDTETTKKLGKILAVEAIIIGNYTVLNDSIKLTIKALDANSGSATAAAFKNLPIDCDAQTLLGLRCTSANSTSNKGFNNSIKSNEDYNNPNSVNEECAIKNTGDYCLSNLNNFPIILNYSKSSSGIPMGYGNGLRITIDPGQTSCIYELPVGTYNYTYDDPTKRVHTGYSVSYGGDDTKPLKVTGQFKVEKCTSKTFIIK